MTESEISFGVLRTAFTSPESKVAILLSEGGSNAREVLNHRNLYPSLNFAAVCSDRKESGALKLSEEFDVPYLYVAGSVKTHELRKEYFSRLASELTAFGVTCLIYAGFMKIATPEFVNTFPGINTHPADLSILDDSGRPRYAGLNVVEKAIRDQIENGVVYGLKPYIASTIHIVTSDVDCGLPLAISKHLIVSINDLKDPEAAQNRLKEYERPNLVRVIEMFVKGTLDFKDLPFKA